MGPTDLTEAGSARVPTARHGKALVKLGYSCNSNCVFCHTRPYRHSGDLTAEQARERVAQARDAGAAMVVFSGGEPTIRPDIVELAGFAQSLGLQTGLITNGRRFVYRDFGLRLVDRGLRYVYVSFHSARGQGHRRATGCDSFSQTLAALSNLSRLDVYLTINVVVTRRNLGELEQVVDLAASFGPARLKLSIVEPKGAAAEEPSVRPALEDAARAVAGALEHARRRHPRLALACEGLTPCLLDGFEELECDLLTEGFSLFREVFEARFGAPDRFNRAKAAVCVDCSQSDGCPGVFTGYLSDGFEPAPLVRARANSFVLLPSPDAREDDPRSVRIALGGRVARYRAAAEDFSDEEVSRALALGQLYLSRGGRHEALDYDRDLIKLEARGRLYRPSRRRVFRELEDELRRRAGALRGNVLDVGCGRIRFRDVLSRLARAGRVRYLGIDPDARAARPGGPLAVRRAGLEDFEAPAESFDHAVLWRSYNHVARPSIAFPKLRRLLRPGGLLTVADGCAFGLALPRAPRRAGAGDFEHYRNHSSREARALLESFGFETLEERPVRPDGGSEWLLAMRNP